MTEAKKPGGRPTIFTEDLGKLICQRLMDAQSLRSICADEDMPGRSTVYLWLIEHEAFANQYHAAREVQAHTLFDENLDIADDSSNDFMARKRDDGSTAEVFNSEHVQRAKLRIDTRKWMAAMLMPKKYGDKIVAEHTGQIEHHHTDDAVGARDHIRRFLEEQNRRVAKGEIPLV